MMNPEARKSLLSLRMRARLIDRDMQIVQVMKALAHLSGPIAVPCPIQLLPPDMEELRSPRFDRTEPCRHNSMA
jgi:hypothetical protein